MKNYTVRLYNKKDDASEVSEWNDFISSAKNATFLFYRDFMEYHQDRFQDYSLMVYEDEKLISVMPANRVGDTIYSHQGLTYGGIVVSLKTKAETIKLVLNAIVGFLKKNNFKTFIFKQIPIFYSLKGVQEIDYFLFQIGAVLVRKDMNLAINLSLPLTISKSKLKHFNKLKTNTIQLVEEEDFNPFWTKVLEPRLKQKYSTNPVHNIEEISELRNKFPDNIKQFSAYYEGEIVAGITIFDSGNVVKSQYGTTTEKGEKVRALDFLFITLIQKYKEQGKLFFDMGIVNENEGKTYNSGLLNQKEELGCSVYNQDYYKLELHD